MSAHNNERSPNITPIYIGTLATSASVVVPGVYFRKHSRIKNVWFVSGATVSKSSSNYLTLTLQDNAGSPVSYAAVATSDTAATAVTPLSLAYTNDSGDSASGQTEKDVPAGTMLDLKVVGLGSAVPTNGVVLIEWYPL